MSGYLQYPLDEDFMNLNKILIFITVFPAFSNACPAKYSEYISNLSFYVKNESNGIEDIIREFNECYLPRKELHEDGTIWHLEYLRNVAYITGDKRVLVEARKFYYAMPDAKNSNKKNEKLLDIAILFRDSSFALLIKGKSKIDREIPPKLYENLTRSILVTKDGVRQWKQFDFPKGGHIVVVANEFCHFSQYFMDYLQSEDYINQSLNEKITWISPVDMQLESGNLIKDIYSTSEWKEIDEWETPSIYFFYNGQLLSKIIGWPKDGKRDEFVANLAKIGINTEAPKRNILPEQLIKNVD